MFFSCCQCCLNIFSSKKDKSSSNKPYLSHVDDADQQQKMTNYINKQAKQLPKQYFIEDTQNQNVSHEMNVNLELNQSQNNRQEIKSPSYNPNHFQNQQNNNGQLLDMDHNQFQNAAEQEPITQEKLKPDYTKFSINIDPYDKHYKLLHEKTQNLEKYFSVEGKPIDFGVTKSNVKALKIDNNKFELRFQLPCSYAFYSMLMKDSNLNNKKFMTLIQKSQVMQAFKPNFTKNIVRLKRFNMLQPRQFIYLKYSNGSFKQNWQICINQTEDDLLSQQSNDYKRCDIFSVSNFKQINDKLYVRQYIEIDLKVNNMNISMWGKIMVEIKDYLQKLYLHVQTYYQKELL